MKLKHLGKQITHEFLRIHNQLLQRGMQPFLNILRWSFEEQRIMVYDVHPSLKNLFVKSMR